MTDDRTPFGAALHARVRDEHPDLDQLIRVSTTRGTRIRRWRRTGVSIAVAAGVAAVAVAGSQLTGSGATTGGEPGFASQPTPASTPTAQADTTPAAPVLPPGTPVYVDATGWQCTEPADEKFICSQGKASVVVNWRAAAERGSYLDPGKADVLPNVHTYVSEAHGRFFATVAPSPGTTQAEVDEVGAALVWVR
jgi:hypothetical protein